jgi:hypothetical protein
MGISKRKRGDLGRIREENRQKWTKANETKNLLPADTSSGHDRSDAQFRLYGQCRASQLSKEEQG